MATQNFINECKNMANANRLGRFELQMYDRFEKEFKGDTFQQTYTGKNLCGIPDQTITKNGVTITIKDGEITLNGTASANGTQILTPIDTTTLNGKAYINIIYVSGTVSTTNPPNFNVRNASTQSAIFSRNLTNGSNNSFYTFTEATEVIFGIYFRSGNVFNNYKFKPQITISSSYDYYYEPYVGGTSSPNPSYPQSIENVTGLQNIEVCGKNLFNKDNIIKLNGTIDNGNNTFVGGGLNYAVVINCKPNTTYTVQKRNDGNTNRFALASSETIPSSTGSEVTAILNKIREDNSSSLTLTTGATAKYLIIQYYRSAESVLTEQQLLDSIQAEIGSTATIYEPYIGNTYEVNLGKNVFNFDNFVTKSENVSIVSQTDDTLVATVTTASTWQTIKYGINNLEENTDYVLRFNFKNTYNSDLYNHTWMTIKNSSNTNVFNGAYYKGDIITFNTGNSTTFSFSFHVTINAPAVVNTITISNVWLEKKTDVIELNKIGDYQDSIKKSTRKNLFDKNNFVYINAYNNTNTNKLTANASAKMLYIPIISGKTYTISKILSSRFNLCTTTEIPNIGVSTSDYISNNSATHITIETSSTAKYLVVMYYINTDTLTEQQILDSIMINEGSTALPYEPYGKVWYIEKNIGKYIFDGSSDENWFKSGNSTTTNFVGACDIGTSGLNLGVKWITPVNWYNNRFTKKTSTELGSTLGWNMYNQQDVYFKNYALSISTSTASDLTAFKTWLSNNNVIQYFLLATPTYTEITNEELINQLEAIQLLKDTNNISITSENLPVIFDYSFWNGDTEIDEDDRFLEVNQSNYLTSIELKDSCCVNNNILGTTYTKSAEVELLNLPVGTKLESQIITPEIGVKYNDDTTEYETFDDYVIESLNDEQTASNTKFTAMNGGTLLDKEYICSLSFENGQTHTINEFYQDACSQIGLTPLETAFDNSEIEITGNPFTNKETIRTVLSEVGKTSCSIIKFDWKNKTISLAWLSDQIDYEFNTSDYSTLEGSLTQYGPLNVIIIGNSQLNGENVTMTDSESVAVNGEHQIMIDSPYFLYTEALRTQAIQAIYNKLDGLTYYDVKLTTPYGKPFLEIGNKIRINTNENQIYDTYVLSHTFKYDGTFNSIIESPALTTEEQTIKNEFKTNSITSKVKRTELMVDKVTGDITALTERVITDEANTYSKEQINELVQNATEGVTNKFITNGGNNILRNTGLWFEDRSEIDYMYPSNTLYPDDDLYMSADPHYEYWKGNAKKAKEDKAVNLSGILLQLGYLEQEQQVRNGTYTLSFKYRKLIQLANCNMQINDTTIQLTEATDTEVVLTFNVSSLYANIKLFSDTDDACVIYDLMLNSGSEKSEYSQHPNETTTETVNISKGITITSSDTNTTFKANTDGIRVYNNKDLDNPVAKYTDTGMETNRIKVDEEAQIVQVLWKNVGNNTWISRL